MKGMKNMKNKNFMVFMVNFSLVLAWAG